MKRFLQFMLLVALLSGSIAALAYIGLPYMPLSLTALRLNSYLYHTPEPPEVLQADFVAEPTIGVRPLAVAFSNTSLGDYTESKWDFGDGFTSSLDDPLHLYFASGSYTVTLTISGTLGTDTVTKASYITVHEPLAASFDAEPTSGLAPLVVSFSNHSSGEYTDCLWDFGDGQVDDSCLDPTHEYISAGSFTVTLAISSTFDVDTQTRVAYIHALDELEADFEGAPTVGTRPLQVSFTNLSSGIYDSCAWDFGDGKTSTKCNPQNVYNLRGTYSVMLHIAGPAGEATLTKSNYVTVYDPIVANFKGTPTSGPSPLEVVFNNTTTGDFDTCTWNFGDDVISHSCDDVVHTYDTPGVYTVSLSASSEVDSDVRTKEAYITVYEPVTADFSAEPRIGPRPLKVSFTDLSSGDYSDCYWHFGDGKSSSQCNPKNTYTRIGHYTVTLSVSGLGGTDTEVKPGYIQVDIGYLYLPVVSHGDGPKAVSPSRLGIEQPVRLTDSGRIGGR